MRNKRTKYRLQLFKNINAQNYVINERDLFKKITFDNEKMDALDATIYTGSFLDTKKYAFSKVPYGTSLFPSKSGVEPFILWNYINHNFYKSNIDEQNYNDGLYLDTDINRTLYEDLTLLNIGQQVYKSNIKPGSLVIKDYSTKSEITIKDDLNCNIVVDNTASFVSKEDLILDISFNEKFKNRISGIPTDFSIRDYSIYKNHGIPSKKVNYIDGFITSGSSQEYVGTQMQFDGDSSIRLNHIQQYRLKENDFSVSFWISASSIFPNSEYQYILSKQELTNLEVKEKQSGLITYKYKKILTGNYPLSIRVIATGSSTGHLYFSRLGGNTEYYITSSNPITGSQHHIVCQKSGSYLQLFIDGELDSSSSFDIDGRTDNSSPIYIGSLNGERMFYSGALDELKIYKKALANTEIQSLADNDYETCYALQTNQIGNIFYKHGDVVISTIHPKYKNVLLGHSGTQIYTSQSINTGFSVEFRGQNKLYEHEIVCKIPAAQFNFSTNPTLKLNNYSDVEDFKPFVTGSDFRLYFTTIGLYNDNYELLAIAKLANPLPKYEDKDINIIVKFDVD
jgi:hypothetical protein